MVAKGTVESLCSKLITIEAHHAAVTCIFTLQATSFRNPLLHTILSNTSYLFLCFYDSFINQVNVG